MSASYPPRLGLLVIGGGPAGLEAVRAYRDNGGQGSVSMVSAETHPPYNRPPLSKDFLRGELDASELPLETADFYDRAGVTLLTEQEVTHLDLTARRATLGSGERLDFATCVLATGSVAAPFEVPGGDHHDVHLLRSRDHGHRLREAAADAHRAVVVGSGFIGCEAAMSLAQVGIAVTMVTPETWPQADRLGSEVGERIAGWLGDAGVELRSGRTVDSVRDGSTVGLDDGSTLSADQVLAATGAKPAAGFVAGSSLDLVDGLVPVDAGMRTGSEGVFAAGDVALAHNETAGRRLRVEHWGEAMAMGAVAGANAAGGAETWSAVPGFWTEIGAHTVKYAAWGDGHDEVRVVDHEAGSFTAWYLSEEVVVGVLTHDADEDYERGSDLVERHAPADSVT